MTSTGADDVADRRTIADRHVVVVGGGIAGLAAAVALLSAPDPPRVTVLESDTRLGGKIRTSPFAELAAVDEGADAFLARVPWAAGFADRLGLRPELVSPQSGRAAVWWDELHDIPEGLLLGMPTGMLGLARTRLLTWSGKVRAATEPLRRRTSLEPDSLGGYVRSRFGAEVHHRLVDPLVGSIYAADTDRFSLAAVPQIAELATRSRSVLLGARHRPPAPNGPVFYAPSGGVGALVDAADAAVEAAGGTIRTGAPVTAVSVDGAGWCVDDVRADAVILACPAPAAVRLLGSLAADAAARLARIPTADVALLTLSVDAADWPARLAGRSGYLVPKPRQRLVTAASFGSQKWAHWDLPGKVVLRVSLGRDGLPVLHLGDDQLLAGAVDDVGRHLGIELQPIDVRISRFPGAFPQYRPHHAELVAGAQAALPPGIALAGASYHGIGIPACIRSGSDSASRTLEHLSSLSDSS
ncbi:MAG: hemY [Ilumatobacteraceae bacterium]|nr:hemY [Ilumatobacteraceae bacterium]